MSFESNQSSKLSPENIQLQSEKKAQDNLEQYFIKNGHDLKNPDTRNKISELAKLGAKANEFDAKKIIELQRFGGLSPQESLNNQQILEMRERGGRGGELPADTVGWMQEEAKRKAQDSDERKKRLGLSYKKAA